MCFAVVTLGRGVLGQSARYSGAWLLALSGEMCCGVPLGLCLSHLFHKPLHDTGGGIYTGFLTWLCHSLWGWIMCSTNRPPKCAWLQHNADLLLVHVTLKSGPSWSMGCFPSVVIQGARQLLFGGSAAVSVTLLSSPSSLSSGQRVHGEGRPAAQRPWLRNGIHCFCLQSP